MYSVKKYFGFLRAAGADHFDAKYRDMPFEKRGIFEAITGDKKFQTATPPGNATYMLKWSILDPAASQFKLVDEQTVNELLPQLKLDLRLRG